MVVDLESREDITIPPFGFLPSITSASRMQKYGYNSVHKYVL